MLESAASKVSEDSKYHASGPKVLNGLIVATGKPKERW
jgi:hypothetical protein